LHDINNWRGIMLMEPALKIFSSILACRRAWNSYIVLWGVWECVVT
jgi:hypothetical protein